MADSINYTPKIPDDITQEEDTRGGFVSNFFKSVVGGDTTSDARLPRWRQMMSTTSQGSALQQAVYKLLSAMPAGSLDGDGVEYNLDVRRLVQDTGGQVDDEIVINDVAFTAEEVRDLKLAAANITIGIEDKYSESLKLSNAKMAGESQAEYNARMRNMAGELARAYLDPDAKLEALPPTLTEDSIDIDPETGLPIAAGDTSQALDDFLDFSNAQTGASAVTQYSFMTPEQRERLFASATESVDAFGQVLGQDQYLQDMQAAGVDDNGNPAAVGGNASRVQYDGEVRNDAALRNISTSSNFDPQLLTNARSFTLTEVLRMPMDMTTQERLNLQEKMEKAKLLDTRNGRPLNGDPTDSRFKGAWKQLAAKSLELGVPMVDLLDERIAQAEAIEREAFSVQLTDPARTRITADSMGRQMIGRKLTEEEHAQMNAFVHDLERKNSMIAAGLDPNNDYEGVEQLDEGIIADIDAQMQQYLRQQAPVEAGANDVADQFDSFSQMLAGPGRGVS
jgi:hypothetical protein